MIMIDVTNHLVVLQRSAPPLVAALVGIAMEPVEVVEHQVARRIADGLAEAGVEASISVAPRPKIIQTDTASAPAPKAKP